jgi:hypothetical protein
MKLPRHELADVPREKVADYLLSPIHPWGRHKAAFFNAFGFSNTSWEELAAALKRHGSDHHVAKIEATPFGTRYVVEGIMKGLGGRVANVRTVWFVAEGETTPRFVTAYPIRGLR